MGEFILHDPLQELHGKLSKKNGRVTYMHRSDSDYDYTSWKPRLNLKEKKARKEKKTAGQQAINEKFTAVARATRARLADPAQMANDKVAFAKQKAYPTLYGFVFHEEWDAYQA